MNFLILTLFAAISKAFDSKEDICRSEWKLEPKDFKSQDKKVLALQYRFKDCELGWSVYCVVLLLCIFENGHFTQSFLV